MLLVAIPIGKLGDHHGRRKILALALLGVAGSLVEVFTVCKCLDYVNRNLSIPPGSSFFLILRLGAFPKLFPLRLVWLSSVLLFFGGGLNSASAYMWAMASESIPAERRQVFTYCYVTALLTL